jgi:hypothetical protein
MQSGLFFNNSQSYQYYQGVEDAFCASDFMYKKGPKVPSSTTESRTIL